MNLKHKQLPNMVTMLRFVLACVFFLILNQYRYLPHGKSVHPGCLWAALIVFVIAAISDAVDGHLARKWNVESTFGRIMDPFCDKFLIVGALIYLAGPRFIDPNVQNPGVMVTGFYPWMVALMLGRELLVTGIRGELEGQGIAFGANIFGKLKMVLQSAAVPLVLFFVWLDPHDSDHQWVRIARDTLVYATVIVTVISGLPYIKQAFAVMKKRH